MQIPIKLYTIKNANIKYISQLSTGSFKKNKKPFSLSFKEAAWRLVAQEMLEALWDIIDIYILRITRVFL